MAAAFLCGHVGIVPAVIETAAAYVQGWLNQLKMDKKLVIGAAQTATDWIRGERGEPQTSPN
jgi:antirestriction protein ArdC